MEPSTELPRCFMEWSEIRSSLRLCVADTAEEYKLHQVELKLINRLAIKNFSTVCKDVTGFALKHTVMFISKVIIFGIKDEILFYVDSKVFKMLVTKFVQYFSAKDRIEYDMLNDLIKCIFALMLKTSDFITLNDVRPLLPHLVDLVDSKKLTAGPPSFFFDRIHLAFHVMLNKSALKEKQFVQLKDSNILRVLIETIQRFEGMNCSVVQWSQSALMCCVAPEHIPSCRLTLREIDQVLPVVPVLIKDLTGKSTPTPGSTEDFRPHAAAYICVNIVKDLLRVKENKTGSIASQLNVLRQFDFVHGICEAVTRLPTENSDIIFKLTATLDMLSRLFDCREFTGNLIGFLPKLMEKIEYFTELGPDSFQTQSQDSTFFLTESCSMMRQAAAFVLDKIDPKFVESKLAKFVMSHWVGFRISGGKMFFSSHHEKTEELFGEKGFFEEMFIDVLRATWWMNRLYPEVVSIRIMEYCPLFEEPHKESDREITELISARIVKTIISYLDHSQDKTMEFLTELTMLVKDLADDLDDENKVLFQELVPACERFMVVNSNKTFQENLQYFIDINRGIIVDG